MKGYLIFFVLISMIAFYAHKKFDLYAMIFSKVTVSDISIPDDYRFRTVDSKIQQEDLIKDLSVLSFALEKHYIGRDTLIGREYKALLASIDELKTHTFESRAELCRTLNQQFKKTNDHSLIAWHPSTSCESIFETTSEYSNDSLWTFDLLKKEASVVGWIRIPTFYIDGDTRADYIVTFERIANKSDQLIIDLRDTSGTFLTTNALLSYFVKDKTLKFQKFQRNDSYTKMMLKNAQMLMRKDKQTFRFFNESVEDLDAAIYINNKIERSDNIYSSTIEGSGKKSKLLKRPIFLIVNSGCRGACEYFANVLSRYDGVKVIGENTTGNFNYDQVGTLHLEQTDLLINVPTRYLKIENDGADFGGLKPVIQFGSTKTREEIIELLD